MVRRRWIVGASQSGRPRCSCSCGLLRGGAAAEEQHLPVRVDPREAENLQAQQQRVGEARRVDSQAVHGAAVVQDEGARHRRIFF
jgi:hypothetical protein